MPKSSERYADRLYVRQTSARRSWDVVDAQHEEEVVAIVANEWGVAAGTTHLLDNRLIAGQPEVRQAAPAGRLWRYTLDYAVPDGAVLPGNPLDLPPRIRWEPGWAAEPIDRDWYGNAIINSAGDAPGQPLLEEFPTLTLTVTRWERVYDVHKFFAFRNRVNTDQFSIFNTWIVHPGQCRVIGYFPVDEFELNTPYARVCYRFDFQEGLATDPDGLRDGFKRRFLDQGRMGWYLPTGGGPAKHAALVDAEGNKVGAEQRLNGFGVTHETSILVGERHQATRNPTPLPSNVVREFRQGATFLKYQTKPIGPVSAIFN